jgi:hypothetical protein
MRVVSVTFLLHRCCSTAAISIPLCLMFLTSFELISHLEGSCNWMCRQNSKAIFGCRSRDGAVGGDSELVYLSFGGDI